MIPPIHGAADPVAELRAACAASGSQKAWAAQAGVSQAYVNDVIRGRREPGDSILGPLGIERVITYRRKP